MKVLGKTIFNTKLLVAVVFVVVYSFITIPPKKGVAVVPFGGPIVVSLPCTCSGGQLVIVGAPAPAILVYQAGTSILFASGQIMRPGPFVLGNYTPGAVCLIGAPPACVPAAVPQGTILGVGTSL